MAVRGSRGVQRARTESERARLYAARTDWHQKQLRRRRRDTVIAVVVGGLIVIGAIVSQTVHAQTTAPVPTPSPSSTDSPAPLPPPADQPDESPEPAPTQSAE
ncbi:hypothetical protein FM104_03720 [Microbacterium esteraromaticum]|uniref:Dioxygenase n=1 Tax=Microbacterium esteraromaticum TaxID=57043 RepID=A0A1R4ISI5_9MICO|nr:hypothetical protein [Microbacterium esteraromaticum]SJN22807.1 hypothetical protein FM104_03720 [Microbacterium esteraromaticum]